MKKFLKIFIENETFLLKMKYFLKQFSNFVTKWKMRFFEICQSGHKNFKNRKFQILQLFLQKLKDFSIKILQFVHFPKLQI